jgi:hypothetical protein
MDQYSQRSEADPLLPSDRPAKKPFYRPRPLWWVSKTLSRQLTHSLPRALIFVLVTRIVPIAMIASLAVHQQRPSLCCYPA